MDRKILIIYEPSNKAFNAEFIDKNIRAFNYEFNQPMYDGDRWAIVVAEESSIKFGVNVLHKKIVDIAKQEIENNIELIRDVDRKCILDYDIKEKNDESY